MEAGRRAGEQSCCQDEALDGGGGVVRAGDGDGGERFLGGGEGLVGVHGIYWVKHFILWQKQGGSGAILLGKAEC
jgi:hypothetical protein